MKKLESKKIISLILICLMVSMSAVTLAKADPLDDKNNDKFQSYGVTAKFSFTKALQSADYNWIPSQAKTNVMVIEYDEQFMQYDITIGTHTYKLGTDFAYTGHAKYVYFEPVFGTTYGPYYPVSYRSQYHVIDYMYDFSAVPGGLEGTLKMRAMFSSNSGEIDINSLAGTDDLQNVQIKATHAGASTVKGITTANHAGYVLGWPE
jgi:hypothetical protein